MTNYTTNLCPNPSFETDLTGYAPANNAVLTQDTTVAAFGSASMMVITPGAVPFEGFTGPQVTLGSTTTCSISLYVMGPTGTVNVAAVTSGGVILAQVQQPLNVLFNRVILNNLTVQSGNVLYVMVTTPVTQDIEFWVDGVQYEPESPAQQYCDGDQPGCFWTGTPEESSSYQPFQNYAADAGGKMQFSGSALTITTGEIFPVTEVVGEMIFSGSGAIQSIYPIAAFNDFGIYELTDIDPAMSYPSWNNAGTLSGHTSYNQIYGMFTPPLDMIVSGGTYLWRRAAFGVLGFSFASVAASQCQNITNVQIETPLINGTNAVTPQTFQPPRQLQVVVEPSRLNYCANPSFETSLSGWSAVSPGTSVQLFQDSTQAAPSVGTYGSVLYNAGIYSLKCVINSGPENGAQVTISSLVTGNTYIASCYVMCSAGFDDVVMTIGSGSSHLASVSTIPYGGNLATPGYGGGPYGGVGSETEIPAQPWTRLSCSFMADADTAILEVLGIVDAAAVYPVTFWLDAVLVEDGEVLNPYFDGSFGQNAIWSGTTNLSQSYYYNEYLQGQHVVIEALNESTPLGISYSAPQYGDSSATT